MLEANRVENTGENSGTIVGNIDGGDVYNNSTIVHQMRQVPPSIINKLIEKLAELFVLNEDEIASDIFDIEEKITYNNLIEYKYIFGEIYASAWYNCDNALRIIDDNMYGSKDKILKSVNTYYLQAKGKIIAQHSFTGKSDIEIIRENADNLVKMVVEKLEQRILKSYRDEKIFDEDITNGIITIVCYTFGECKILEKPRCDTK